jgi:hypothetical protein
VPVTGVAHPHKRSFTFSAYDNDFTVELEKNVDLFGPRYREVAYSYTEVRLSFFLPAFFLSFSLHSFCLSLCILSFFLSAFSSAFLRFSSDWHACTGATSTYELSHSNNQINVKRTLQSIDMRASPGATSTRLNTDVHAFHNQSVNQSICISIYISTEY